MSKEKLTKAEIIESLHGKLNLNRNDIHEVIDAFFDELFVNITSLYRLDQTGAINGRIELGPLPKQSKILIVSIISSWVIIACYFVYLKTKNRS